MNFLGMCGKKPAYQPHGFLFKVVFPDEFLAQRINIGDMWPTCLPFVPSIFWHDIYYLITYLSPNCLQHEPRCCIPEVPDIRCGIGNTIFLHKGNNYFSTCISSIHTGNVHVNRREKGCEVGGLQYTLAFYWSVVKVFFFCCCLFWVSSFF